MTDHDRSKQGRGGEALRKHREKRRAKQAANKQPQPASDSDAASVEKNSHTASTERSLGDLAEMTPTENQEPKEIMAEIVATVADREKMRKISILGLEDPADRVKHGRHKHELRKDTEIIISAEESLETMRKISVLGLEDPADRLERTRKSGKYRRGTSGKEREKRPSSTGRARPRGSKGRRYKSDSVFDPLDDALENDAPVPRRRARSVDADLPLVDDIYFSNNTEEGSLEFPPLQVAIPEHEAAQKRRSGPKAFSGFLETTKEQQQLMRKVSALGMYDPVFGNIHKDMEISHASIVFEDMDLNDVPEDMRDILGHTSEHTDQVLLGVAMKEEEGEDSPLSSNTSDLAGNSTDSDEVRNNIAVSHSKDFIPPRGSFTRRVSRRNLDIPLVGAPAITPSPPAPKGMKKSFGRHANNGKSSDPRPSKAASDSGRNQFTKSLDFIPPSGSFNLRKPRARASAPTREALLKDSELAARAQSMFAEDSLLAMSASNLEQSISNLGASLGSINFDASASSLDCSMKCASEPKRGGLIPPQPRFGGDLPPSPSNTGDALRAQSTSILPEMRFNGTNNRSPRKPTSHPKRKPIARQNSSRSWEGDKDLHDPMAMGDTSPMWASLSHLDTNFSTLESILRK